MPKAPWEDESHMPEVDRPPGPEQSRATAGRDHKHLS